MESDSRPDSKSDSVSDSKSYDVVVCGCGTAGMMAGKAAAEAGLRVLVVDNKKKSDVGKKTCGDGIDARTLSILEKQGIELGKAELVNETKYMALFSPDRKTRILVPGKGFIIDRYKFGQKLLWAMLESGAMTRFETHVTGPIVVNDKVIGVATDKGKIYARVTIDATGMASALRRKLGFQTDFPKDLGNGELGKCYREIAVLKKPLSAEDSKTASFWFGAKSWPGGYFWMFPKSRTTVNMGLGIMGPFNPKEKYDSEKDQSVKPQVSRILDSAGGLLPLRKPFYGLVCDGLMLVGDAASQVSPLSGGGIENSIASGIMAGEAAAKAVGNPTREGLWAYNREWESTRGASQAQQYVIAGLINSSSDEELNFMFSRKLISSKDVEAYLNGRSAGGISSALAKMFLGFSRPELLWKLSAMKKKASRLKAHFRAYPRDLKHFERWASKADRIFAE